MTKLTPTEQTTLKAFLLALSQLDVPLSPELQDAVRQVGRDLKTSPTTAITEIPVLVRQHSKLEELYQTARATLQGQYRTQERDKLFWNSSGAATLSFEDFAWRMLAAEDFKTAMKQWVSRIQNSDDSFTNALKTSISLSDERKKLQAFSVLEALEFHPLTVENLSYKLDMPIEGVRPIVQNLWQQGKIDTVEGGTLRKVFPFLRKRKQPKNIDDCSTYLTLTSMGFFRLHPITKIGH